MEIKKGDKVRVIEDTIFSEKFPKGAETTVAYVDANYIWLDPEEGGNNAFYPYELELIEDNQEYLKMRGLDNDIELEPCHDSTEITLDPLFPDENPNIRQTFLSLHDLLQFKNKRYGNSSLEPINVLSKADSTTGLLQRADDKIARIKNSPDLRKNDVADLIGYLVLICVSKGWDNFDEFKD